MTRRPKRDSTQPILPVQQMHQTKQRQQSLLPAGEYHLVVSEAEWQRFVIDLAQTRGWWVYHTLRSKGSQAGFPDLVLIRPPRLVFAELKREGGKLSPVQLGVMQLLQACPGVESYVWRPSDRDLVLTKLQ